MTAEESKEQFLRRHGIQFEALQRDPMWRDLMELCRAHDPARAMPSYSAEVATSSAQYLNGTIAGAAVILNLLDHGIRLQQQFENPPETWGAEETTAKE